MLSLLLAALIQLPPVPAAHVAAWLVGSPEIAPALVSICHRESRCQPLGVHDIDAHISPRAYWGQVRLGHLRRVCQRHGRTRGRWSTRGAFGLQAASHWQYLPPCYQPEMLDVPLVAALVAAHKYRARCTAPKARRRGWCHTGPKTPAMRT